MRLSVSFGVLIVVTLQLVGLQSQSDSSFHPSNCTYDEWLYNQGSCDPATRTLLKAKCKHIRKLLAEDMGLKYQSVDDDIENDGPAWSCIEGDIMLEEEQLDALEAQLTERKKRKQTTTPINTKSVQDAENSTSSVHIRQKRKIYNFNVFPIQKWPVYDGPIVYKVDSIMGRADVEKALKLWEEKTCVTFTEIPLNQTHDEPHILFTSVLAFGCYSSVGRSKLRIPQPIYMGISCVFQPVVIAHEIGHVLGLFHEHQRPDRDKYIKVITSNLVSGSEANFNSVEGTLQTLNVEYDLASAMHYDSYQFSKGDKGPSIVTKDELMTRTIGQRVELSFLDYKIINLAYCNWKCKRPTRKKCRNGGYQDPKHCERCLCPDGWGGPHCRQVAPPVGAQECGGVVKVKPVAQAVTSPGYLPSDPNSGYQPGQECSWLIDGTQYKHSQIELKFVGMFGLRCVSKRSCKHWVEIRYNGNMGRTGPRFCCNQTPKVTLTSSTNQVLVIFKAKSDVNRVGDRRGFKLLYRLKTNLCKTFPCKNGGKCHDEFTHVRCDCPANFTGKFCEDTWKSTTTGPPTVAPATTPTTKGKPAKITKATTVTTTIATTSTTATTVATTKPSVIATTDIPCDDHIDSGHQDIVFVMDVSRDISPSQWDEEFRITKSFINYTDIGKNDTLMGAVSIGDVPVTHLLPKDSHDKSSARRSIEAIQRRPGENADVVRALKSVQNVILTYQNGARPRVYRKTVLLTVCNKKFASTSLQDAIASLNKARIAVTVICLGGTALTSDFDKTLYDGMFSDATSMLQHDTAKLNLQATCHQAPKPEPPKVMKMDLVFAIDTSSNVDNNLWNTIVDYIERVLLKFEVGQSSMKVGLLTFGQGATYQSNLGQFISREYFLNKLNNIKLPKERYNANIYHALWQLRTDMFRGKVDRREAKNVAVFLVSSPSVVGSRMLSYEARNVRNYGIEVIGFGLGSGAKLKEINTIAQNAKKVHMLKRPADIVKYADITANDLLVIGNYKATNNVPKSSSTITSSTIPPTTTSTTVTTTTTTPKPTTTSTTALPTTTTTKATTTLKTTARVTTTTSRITTLKTTESVQIKDAVKPGREVQLCDDHVTYYSRICHQPCGACGTLNRWRVCKVGRSVWRIETCELIPCGLRVCTKKDKCNEIDKSKPGRWDVKKRSCPVPCCNGMVTDDGQYCRAVKSDLKCPNCCSGYKPVFSTDGQIVCVPKSRDAPIAKICAKG